MHVIAKSALIEFWLVHPTAKGPLEAWHQLMESRDFVDFSDIRSVFGSADSVHPHIVFNIGGNKYRLIATVHYNRRKVFVRHILTHAKYDDGSWKK
jgi:mRNA interferase HigB